MLSPRKKNIHFSIKNKKMPKLVLEKEDIPCNLLKDFRNPVNQNDFMKLKENPNKKLGIFDDVMSLLYKKNKNIYYVKAIEKKNIIDSSYQNILNQIYKINIDKSRSKNNININIFNYILNLQTHWEDDERLFLVFSGIKKYTLLENLLKNHSEYITEENIICIFRQILEIVDCLHENNIFGCNLYIESFIYDKNTHTIKLTDLGFSKFYKSNQDLHDKKFANFFKFNEYISPEFITKMNDSSYISYMYDQDKLKNSYFDVWQLGILFYKIATFGESPYDNAQNEDLKEHIMSKNINYSKLNKYSPKITQIIDKMLQPVPNNRYTIRQLLNLDIFKSLINIPSLIINTKSEEKIITMNMVNNEKENIKDGKADINNNSLKEINDDENKDNDNNKNILNHIKIDDSLVKDKATMISQEIYPEGSILPVFKNKFLNRFNNIDKNLVMDLSDKLSMLEKEYKKLEENKLAVYNITNYVNSNVKEFNMIDNDIIDNLIKKFNGLQLSKVETNTLYEEMVKNKDEFAQDKFKALISNLIFEIKRLEIDLEQEKLAGEKMKKKIKEQERKNMELKNEVQEKVEFYEKKIELLEEIIFKVGDKNSDKDSNNNNNQLIYQALSNSIKNFTDINLQLKESLEENLSKFRENKNLWLQDMIKAKENFRNEIQFYLKKQSEPPKIYIFDKKENKDTSAKNKKDEKIEELTKLINELRDLVNEQKSLIDKNTKLIKDLKKEIKNKEEENEELTRLLKKEHLENQN